MSLPLTLHVAADTHRGRVRELNEDAVLALARSPENGPCRGLLAVADGMGGHQAGEVASRLALETIHKWLGPLLEQEISNGTAASSSGDPLTDTAPGVTNHLEEQVRSAINKANSVIYDYAGQNPEEAGNLGCTLTCAIVQGDLAVIANVGDSRTYLLHEGHLLQITQDHSYVGELMRKGQLSPDEIFDHPQRNVVTRALGNQPDVDIDLWSYPLYPGDRLLLCSDGLWEMVRDPAMIAQAVGETESVEVAVQTLIDLANVHGGADNIGVVVAEMAVNHR